MNTQLINKLEAEAEHLHVIMASAEPWAKQYEKDPETHAKLIKHEAKYERELRSYFRGLRDRLPNYINWTVYQQKVMKAYDISATINVDNYSTEDDILLNIVIDLTSAGVAIGAAAGEAIYNTPLGIDMYAPVVQQFAAKQSASLVKNINDTTLKYIQSSLNKSISLGETTDQAAARIDKMIKDPRRSGTIARTESVSSYQSGINIFGQQSGAVGKEWQATLGACEICSPLDGIIVPIDAEYNGDVGTAPPGHPNCRCGQRLVYQAELDDDPGLFDN